LRLLRGLRELGHVVQQLFKKSEEKKIKNVPVRAAQAMHRRSEHLPSQCARQSKTAMSQGEGQAGRRKGVGVQLEHEFAPMSQARGTLSDCVFRSYETGGDKGWGQGRDR
jgi:hypothetical protein